MMTKTNEENLTWKEKQKQRARAWIKILLEKWFRIEVKGQYQANSHSVIIANRASIIDVLLLSVFLPERLTLALHPDMFKKIWVKTLLFFADVIVVDPGSAQATRVLIRAIRAGKRCLLFPQGLLRQQEDSLKVFEGPGLILQKVGAEVIPVRIEGAEHSIFSNSKNKHRIRIFPKITLHILPAQKLIQDENTGVDREGISLRLFQLISDLSFANSFKPYVLFSALIEGVSIGAKNKTKIEDNNRIPLTYRQFLARCFILGRQIKKQTAIGETVGVMMPTTIAGMVTFFALQAYRRIPAMLNFSMGFYNLYSACNTARIKSIYTARQFIETARLEPLVEELQQAGIRIHYLEDFKSTIHLGNKLSGIFKGFFPTLSYRFLGDKISPDTTGIILFTSGSEGKPKGVALSHANILANCWQMTSRVDFTPRDVLFNSLPIFHCFGLTAGSVLPLVNGLNCFFYPSPLHYKVIPGLVYQTGATILFGTDTFLTGYARAAGKHDFNSVRYIFAGAEKVKPETIRYWSEAFGARIYEGYGATEASPVISLNCPLASVPGSVGMILPFMDFKVEPVEGIVQGGRLKLCGPNIMLGYLDEDKPGVIIEPEDGWHDTGDIVTVNADGFITIAGRAKRFAKIAGEMVSLTAVEGIAASIWPELLHAAVVQKSPRKGEQIFLFTEAEYADKVSFIKKVKERGQSELLVPHMIYPACQIPVLPSGKIDYITLEKQFLEQKETMETV
ncbi:TPA: AMP-binding protein [Legionella pneumophila]|uniref:Acyl-[ACP]--phospholipid O-acyltransferase n=2 Tax=Legionella pneumophila TaxID=446 RepID=A0A3A6UQP5_LEGPN|nr:AMP-binding protein [Legionella pneumophila]ANN94777.1 ACP synthetase [Legionella pneumophila]MCW8393864.1 AMP-binding protein [Legionella pneumophila]MCW8407081.1 AMP-binding protein [Legionella pneumophila]MCW8430508.1 AMP-binding protein [Legionella pneumophila]MCW8439946.1 AMP-binding protein [Legionella pneumophila]